MRCQKHVLNVKYEMRCSETCINCLVRDEVFTSMYSIMPITMHKKVPYTRRVAREKSIVFIVGMEYRPKYAQEWQNM